jgi:hypothetical protein
VGPDTGKNPGKFIKRSSPISFFDAFWSLSFQLNVLQTPKREKFVHRRGAQIAGNMTQMWLFSSSENRYHAP